MQLNREKCLFVFLQIYESRKLASLDQYILIMTHNVNIPIRKGNYGRENTYIDTNKRNKRVFYQLFLTVYYSNNIIFL